MGQPPSYTTSGDTIDVSQHRLNHIILMSPNFFFGQTLSGLEQGKRNPTIVSIYELGQALGVSHEQLVAVADMH